MLFPLYTEILLYLNFHKMLKVFIKFQSMISKRNEMDEITSAHTSRRLFWKLNGRRGDEVQRKGYSETRHLAFIIFSNSTHYAGTPWSWMK